MFSLEATFVLPVVPLEALVTFSLAIKVVQEQVQSLVLFTLKLVKLFKFILATVQAMVIIFTSAAI